MCRNFIKRNCLCKCNEKTNWLPDGTVRWEGFHSFVGGLSQLVWAWGVVSGICWVCIASLFASHLEIKVTILLINFSPMDGFFLFVYITLRLKKKKIRIPSPFLNLSGNRFQFQSDPFWLWFLRYLRLPCCSGAQFEQRCPREVRKSHVPNSWRLWGFLSRCFFHTVQTAGTTHTKLELSQILMKRDLLPFLSLFLPSSNC